MRIVASRIVRAGEPLTPREFQVLGLICQGMTSKETASYLGIAWRTIDCHRARVVAKLGARNHTHAAAIAVRDGIIDLDAVVSTDGPIKKVKLLPPETPIVGKWLRRGGRLS